MEQRCAERVAFRWYDAAAGAIIDKDGWLHTGDLAREDKEGYYYITGRKKNGIIPNGGGQAGAERTSGRVGR